MGTAAKSAPHPFGVFYVLTFNLLSAIQAVYISGLLQKASLFSTIAITFSFVSVFFVVVNLLRREERGYAVRAVMPGLSAVNLTTAGSWFGFFAALKYIDPATVSALANAVGPLLTLLITAKMTRSDALSRHEVAAAAGVFICMAWMVYATYKGSGGLTTDTRQLSLGIGMAFLCGLSMTVNTVVSQRLNTQGVKPHSIMASRFVFIIVLAFGLAGFEEVAATLQAYWPKLLLIALLGNIVPLYVLQVGISKTPPVVVSFALVLAPLFYFTAQQWHNQASSSPTTLVCILLSLGCLCYGIIAKYRLAGRRT